MTLKENKFHSFMVALFDKGYDIKSFTKKLNNDGHEYKYATVRRKLKGETFLTYDDIVIFSDSLGVDESIFFNKEYTSCIQNNNLKIS